MSSKPSTSSSKRARSPAPPTRSPPPPPPPSLDSTAVQAPTQIKRIRLSMGKIRSPTASPDTSLSSNLTSTSHPSRRPPSLVASDLSNVSSHGIHSPAPSDHV